ncbi:50S ribosomal protein L1 [bacterium CG10_46_32]|nr:MAG: 50S ribosomal protein L1 [bacterium CG10_46_32]PIR55687.1 MAG: 50S ribosomal protein L1 [Parcubacteria group bacterium CG10_big_fil_rev_8_21_14_0_10_46_32]
MAKHSKRYRALKEKVESGKAYSLDQALELLKEAGNTTFDAGVEIHVKIGIDVKQSDQQVRGTVSLPHGTGKKQRIAALTAKPADAKSAGAALAGGEELIKEIQTGKIDFDVLVAEPAFMAKLAPVAKILGPRGLMPSPKNGTVAPDIAKAIEELSKGKISFKNDNTGNIHLLVGRTSFPVEKLKENIQTTFDVIKASKPAASKGTFIKNTTLATTMGPGIKVVF